MVLTGERRWLDRLFEGMLVLVVYIPWGIVRIVAAVANAWQRLLRPVNRGLYDLADHLDRTAPTIISCFCLGSSMLSIAIHFVHYVLDFMVILVLHRNGHTNTAWAVLGLMIANHYLMAVIMFMELDMDTMTETSPASFFLSFLCRLYDVLAWDAQLAAAVVHGNKMIDGLTQMLLNGYEEARVALHACLVSIPLCVLLSITCQASLHWPDSWADLPDRIKQHYSLRQEQNVLYAALALSIINALEKLVRLSKVNPDTQGDELGYPFMYVRSSAARLPQKVVADWLLRCQTMLVTQRDKLVLKELFSHYVFQVRSDFLELCDAHKAYLVRRAFRTFNDPLKTRHHILGLVNETSIKVLDASGIRPGRHLSRLLGDALLEVTGFHTVLLTQNFMPDAAASDLLHCLGMNVAVTVKHVDLGNNNLSSEQAGEAVAELLGSCISVESLRLANNPLQDAAISGIAEGLKNNCVLQVLDLSGTACSTEGADALGRALKSNNVLSKLSLARTRIATAGCIALANGLKANVGLRELDLSGNSIDDRGASALAAALEVNHRLRNLDLGMTHLTDTGASALLEAFKKNSTLQSINVMGCAHLDSSWQKLLSYASAAPKQAPTAAALPQPAGSIAARR